MISQTIWLLPVASSRVQPLSPNLFCVRDDLRGISPYCSGNKARKLDALLPVFAASGITDVVTCGGLHSAHASAVAVACRAFAIRSHLQLRGEAQATLAGNAAAATAAGAQLRFVSREAYADTSKLNADLAAELQCTPGEERRAAVVPEGAACPAAVLGLLRAARALSGPAGGLSRDKDTVLVVDSGTGCTATSQR